MDELDKWSSINEAQHLDYYPFICSFNYPFLFFSIHYYEEYLYDFLYNNQINVKILSYNQVKQDYNIIIKEYPKKDICLISLLEIPKTYAYINPKNKLLKDNNRFSIHTLYQIISEYTNSNIWYPELDINNKLETFKSYLIDLTEQEINYIINISPMATIKINEDYNKEIIKKGLYNKIQKGINEIMEYNPQQNVVFVRLYSLSPKHQSSTNNQLIASSPDEVLHLIIHSSRAISSLEESITNGIMLREFISDLNTDYEFRIFIHGGCLRAISQYKCYSKISEFQDNETQTNIYNSICLWWKDIFKILSYNECTIDIVFYNNELSGSLLWNKENIKIVEINSFGAGSLCGSSLYSWIVDFDILYYAKPPVIRFVES